MCYGCHVQVLCNTYLKEITAVLALKRFGAVPGREHGCCTIRKGNPCSAPPRRRCPAPTGRTCSSSGGSLVSAFGCCTYFVAYLPRKIA